MVIKIFNIKRYIKEVEVYLKSWSPLPSFNIKKMTDIFCTNKILLYLH